MPIDHDGTHHDDLPTPPAAPRTTARMFGDVERKLDVVIERQRQFKETVDSIDRRLQKHEERSAERAVFEVNLQRDVTATRKSLRALSKATRTVPDRLAALEAEDKHWRRRHATRRRTLREIFVQVTPGLLLALGGTVVGWATSYFTKSPSK